MTDTVKKMILVIDDDDVLRDLMQSMLTRMDYNVLTASSGDEAVQVSKTSSVKIDAAILDLFLPDIRGDKICPEIQENHPELKIILMSGYGLQDTDFLNVKTNGFIQKPCTYQELEETLNKIFAD